MARAKKATAKQSRPNAEDREAWIIAEQRRILAEHESAARDLEPSDDEAAPVHHAVDAKGNVRPADDRYLSDKQIAERDAYQLEKADDQTREAQQILENAGSSAGPLVEDDQEVLPNV